MKPGTTDSDNEAGRRTVDEVFADGGEMGALGRVLDWSATPLGSVDDWSFSLRTTVATVIRSRHPMFLFWGPELVQVYNDAYRPSLGEGGRHPRALGMGGRDFWTEIWDIIGPQIDAVMRNGEATWHQDQLVAIERNGRIEEVYWTYSYSPVRDDDGSIGGTLVVCQETTPRVIAERRLRTLHRMAALTPHGSPEQAAEEATRLLAEPLDVPFSLCYLTPRGDADAEPVLQLATGLDAAIPADRWPLREVVRDRRIYHVDVRGWPQLDGVGPWPERPESAVVIPLAPSDRDPTVGALVIGLSARLPWSADYKEFALSAASHVGAKVWARHLHEDREQRDCELELERARLDFVFRHAPSFLAVLRGPAHIIERVNEAYNHLVGHRDIIGRPIAEALPEIAEQGFVDLLTRVLRSGEPFIGREVPVFLAREPGAPPEQRYLDFVYMPMHEADGSRSGVIAHGADVTEQVLARREVERLLVESEAARSEAEHANRAKTRFLANMSHELRTPINAVLGYADLLDAGVHGSLSPKHRMCVERIKASSRHLMGLVNDVLDLSRIEAGRMSVSQATTPLGDTVRQAIEMILPQARDRGVEIESGFSCDRDVSYTGDADRVLQILVNLLSNAVKFTPPGGRVVNRCSIRPRPSDDGEARPWVAIDVEDTGAGIEDGQLERIFEPFVQLDDSSTRNVGGTGLGLTISRQLARIMGGDLTVRSHPGEGACFTLWLNRTDGGGS